MNENKTLKACKFAGASDVPAYVRFSGQSRDNQF